MKGKVETRSLRLAGGYQYEETMELSRSSENSSLRVVPSFGVPGRMCPQHTPAGEGIGCIQQCKVDMPNTTYMDGHPTGANWSREYDNDVFVFDTRTERFGRAEGTSVNDPGLILDGCGAFPM